MICRTRGIIHPPHPPPNLPLEGGGTWLPPFQGEGWGGDGAVFGFGIAPHRIRHFMRDVTLEIVSNANGRVSAERVIAVVGS